MKLCNIHIKNLIILSVSGIFKGFKNWQKVAEICFQLVHDRASRGLALFLIWRQTHLHGINSLWTCMQNSFWRQIKNRLMPLTSSVMKQSISNFRLYCCSKKIQMLRKKVKLLLEQLKVCISAKIVFGVRCTLNTIATSEMANMSSVRNPSLPGPRVAFREKKSGSPNTILQAYVKFNYYIMEQSNFCMEWSDFWNGHVHMFRGSLQSIATNVLVC